MHRHYKGNSLRRKYKIYILFVCVAVAAILAYFYVPTYLGSSMYPLNYQNEIIAASKEFSVDPNFIAAVIYTESHFHRDSHSGVGAIGLMQIMPSTGASIAKQLGDKSFTVANLYDPARNIRYGTYYLKQNLNKYGGSEKLVLMHYNGGPRAVNSYRTRGTLPRETEGFVRKVTGTKNVYATIYGAWWIPKEKFQPLNTTAKPNINVKEFWRVMVSSKGGW